jgi:hypothetical protein
MKSSFVNCNIIETPQNNLTVYKQRLNYKKCNTANHNFTSAETWTMQTG